jgi:hypothetical protein
MKSVRIESPRLWLRVLLAAPAGVVTVAVLLLPMWARPVTSVERANLAARTAAEVLVSGDPEPRRTMVVVRTAVAPEAPGDRLRDAGLLDGVGLLAIEKGEAGAAVKWRRDADHCLGLALGESGMEALRDVARRAYLGMRTPAEWARMAEGVAVGGEGDELFVGAWVQLMGGKAEAALKVLEPGAGASPRQALLAAVAAHAVQKTEVRDRMARAALDGQPALGALERAGAEILLGRYEEAFAAAEGAGAEAEPVRSSAIAEIAERWLRSGTFYAPASVEAHKVLEAALRAAPDSPYLASVVLKLPAPGEPVGEAAFPRFLSAVQAMREGAGEAVVAERLAAAVAKWPDAAKAAARVAAVTGKRGVKVAMAAVDPALRRRTFMEMGPVDPLWALLWRRSQ